MGEETIPWTQFGFREGHSTIDALTVFKNEIDNCISRKEFLAVASLDIKKAFDSVWHRGLVYKVHKAGCDLFTTKMVQSFLLNRVAKIKVDGLLSNDLEINRGVPQGTRLGPLLYNIYTGDLKLDLSYRERLQTYADDTLLSYCSANAFLATKKVAERIEEVDKYLNNWGIEINAEKTDFMVVRPPGKALKGSTLNGKNGKKLILPVRGKEIPASKELKYLGVTFQDKGRFNKHISNMATRGRRLIGVSRRVLSNKSINHKTKILMYKTLIRSSVTYASAIWAVNENVTKLDRMERWAFRYALNTFRNPETKKYISNEIIYELMECETLQEFLAKTQKKYKERLENHDNPIVQRAVECK